MFFNLPFHDFREEDEESTADEMKISESKVSRVTLYDYESV